MDWIVQNFWIFIVLAVVILLGLIGYWYDRKLYERYRQEILNEEYAENTMAAVPGIDNVATSIPVSDPNYGYDQSYQQGQPPVDNGTGYIQQ